jgi:peptidoglycan hydrolase-like protein with peptidoglycan-binding domain
MPKYDLREPLEGLGLGNQPFTDFRSLHTHHPGTNRRAVNAGNPNGLDDRGAIVDGEVEVVRLENGNTLIKKDIIFFDQKGSANVQVPAPIAGYAHYLTPNDFGSVRIYDKPFGTPGAELVGQVLHMDPRSFKFKEGERIEYGQPIGLQSGKGPNGLNHFGTHAHVELELEQFKKYIADLKSGAITQETYPAKGSVESRPAPPANAMSDGVLQLGEKGPDVKKVQEQLIKLGYKGADGKALSPDSDFGDNTKFAVEAFQRASKIGVDGKVGEDTFAALKKAVPAQAPTTPTAPSPPTPGTGTSVTGGTSVLSNLIGRGESNGSYNAYNKGTTSDRVPPLNLTEMTVGEIMRRQHLPKGHPDAMFAAGKFQMVGPPPNTMGETVRALGIDHNAKFTPELQEKMFANYLIDGKRPAVNDYITGKSSGVAGLEKAQHALALEFASVGDPRNGGRGAYDGDSAGNHASISVKETAAALNQMRTEYQANIAKGLSPDAAYDALRGQAPSQGNTKPTTPGQTGAMADGVLKQGETGPEVKLLQEQLNRLGFKDAQGRSLNPDSDFGDRTRQAVEAFQRARGIEDDGKVGKNTFAELKKAEAEKTAAVKPEAAPLLSNGKHADNPMYQQADSLLAKLPAGTFKSEQERHNAAAALTYEARVSGMSKIDSISLNTSGSGFIATQGNPQTTGERIMVQKDAAVAQSVEKSTQMVAQDVSAPPKVTPDPQVEQQKKPSIMV